MNLIGCCLLFHFRLWGCILTIRSQSLSTLLVPFHSSEFVCTSFCMYLQELHLGGGGVEGGICLLLPESRPTPHLRICKWHHARCITVYYTVCYTMLHRVTSCYTVSDCKGGLGKCIYVGAFIHAHYIAAYYTVCYTVIPRYSMLHCVTLCIWL